MVTSCYDILLKRRKSSGQCETDTAVIIKNNGGLFQQIILQLMLEIKSTRKWLTEKRESQIIWERIAYSYTSI